MNIQDFNKNLIKQANHFYKNFPDREYTISNKTTIIIGEKNLSPKDLNTAVKISIYTKFQEASADKITEGRSVNQKKEKSKETRLEIGSNIVELDNISYKVGSAIHENIGKSATCEDGLSQKAFLENEGTLFGLGLAVFDGHGGPETKNHLQNNLLNKVEAKLKTLPKENLSDKIIVGKAIAEAFKECNKDWFESTSRIEQSTGTDNGSTACVALVVGGNLYIANTGDSSAVLVTEDKVTPLSQEADPKVHKYQEDVKRWGKFKEDDLDYPGYMNGKMFGVRFDKGEWRLNPQGGPSTTRAFGDFSIKGLRETLEILSMPLSAIPKGSCLVLASDGLWSVGSRAMVGEFVQNEIEKETLEIAQGLVVKARNSDKTQNDKVIPGTMTILSQWFLSFREHSMKSVGYSMETLRTS